MSPRLRFAPIGIWLLAIMAPPAARAQSDTTPPTLVSFDFAPRTVDVSGGPEDVTFTARITDGGVGVRAFAVVWESPASLQIIQDPVGRLISGDAHDGVWRIVLRVRQYSEAGIWLPVTIAAQDSLFNTTSLQGAAAVAEQGFPTDLEVLDSNPDVAAPSILAFDFAPRSIDVSDGPQDVTFTARIADGRAGVAAFAVAWESPAGHAIIQDSSGELILGDAGDGVWRIVLRVPRYSEPGIWLPTTVAAQDSLFNTVSFSGAAAVAQQGFPTDLEVVNRNPDLDPPGIHSFEFSPRFVNVTGGPQDVTFTAHLTDAVSGVRSLAVAFQSPGGHQVIQGSPGRLVSGDARDGTWENVVTVPRLAELGTWRPVLIAAQDSLFQSLSYPPESLEARGFPTDLVVTDATTTQVLTVSIQGRGAVSRFPDLPLYPTGTLVRLTATPAAGWEFVGWRGDATGTDNPLSLIMDTDKSVTAVFGVRIDFDLHALQIRLHEEEMHKRIRAVLQPAPPDRADEIVIPSIRINGAAGTDPSGRSEIGDANQDGIPDLTVAFRRTDLSLVLPPGDAVPVVVTGTIGGDAFIGRDVVRVKAGHVGSPHAGEVLEPGAAYVVRYDASAGEPVRWVTLLGSFDGGVHWSVERDLLPSTGEIPWQAPLAAVESALVAVVEVEEEGGADVVTGVLGVSGYFSIGSALAVGGDAVRFELAPVTPNPSFGRVVFRYGNPARGKVAIDLFDVQGRMVRSIESGVREAGWHEVMWDSRVASGDPAAAGLYVVRLRASGRETARRIVRVR